MVRAVRPDQCTLVPVRPGEVTSQAGWAPDTPAPELQSGRITIHDPGKRERTVDRPLEPRYKKLYEQIMSSGTCSALALN